MEKKLIDGIIRDIMSEFKRLGCREDECLAPRWLELTYIPILSQKNGLTIIETEQYIGAAITILKKKELIIPRGDTFAITKKGMEYLKR
jgi:hypothetical protein